MVGEGGFAFLRKSHAGCEAPPGPRQEPAFESTLNDAKRQPRKCGTVFLVGEGGFELAKFRIL